MKKITGGRAGNGKTILSLESLRMEGGQSDCDSEDRVQQGSSGD